MKKNRRAARGARFLVQFCDVVYVARSSKSFVHCLCTKTIHAKQEKAHFAYFVRRDQLGIIEKHLTWRKVLFYSEVVLEAAVVALKLPFFSQRTAKKCTKMKNARAGHAQRAEITVAADALSFLLALWSGWTCAFHFWYSCVSLSSQQLRNDEI